VTRVSHALDRIEATFDDPNLVANAGLLLVATLSERLGLEDMIDSTVRLDGRVGGARPGRKVLTLAHALCAGGSHIDHADMLRAGATAAVLGHRVMAPSTIGTFLRSFTFGHCRQMEAVIGHALERAWSAGAGPGAAPLVIDIDSTICEVDGNAKHGAGFGYTHALGYHPLLATRADTGEVLHARMRKGSANTQRGAVRFIDELVARVRRAGAAGELTVRVDSGFWSNDTIVALNRLNVRYTMAVRCATQGIAEAIAAIPEAAWVEIDYTPDGQAQVADCAYITGKGKHQVTRRLVVRRTRLTGRAQQRLWPDWRHHAFLTDLDATVVEVDRFHRHHAVVELAIRDLKEGAGLEHVPSGNFHANSAWLQCAVLAHNLFRWTAICGEVRVDEQLIVARTIRTRLLALPARLVNRAGRPTLRLPTDWPWAKTFITALDTLRALRPAPG
jgi:Transposase DDE domain group 1